MPALLTIGTVVFSSAACRTASTPPITSSLTGKLFEIGFRFVSVPRRVCGKPACKPPPARRTRVVKASVPIQPDETWGDTLVLGYRRTIAPRYAESCR
jgi:hypothetical protein